MPIAGEGYMDKLSALGALFLTNQTPMPLRGTTDESK